MADIQFPEGVSIYAKNDKAPEWVGDTIVIDKAQFSKWLQSQPDKVRLQICVGKTGKKYAKVDTYQPKAQQTADLNDLPF